MPEYLVRVTFSHKNQDWNLETDALRTFLSRMLNVTEGQILFEQPKDQVAAKGNAVVTVTLSAGDFTDSAIQSLKNVVSRLFSMEVIVKVGIRSVQTEDAK